jgi:hypothetical protein
MHISHKLVVLAAQHSLGPLAALEERAQ